MKRVALLAGVTAALALGIAPVWAQMQKGPEGGSQPQMQGGPSGQSSQSSPQGAQKSEPQKSDKGSAGTAQGKSSAQGQTEPKGKGGQGTAEKAEPKGKAEKGTAQGKTEPGKGTAQTEPKGKTGQAEKAEPKGKGTAEKAEPKGKAEKGTAQGKTEPGKGTAQTEPKGGEAGKSAQAPGKGTAGRTQLSEQQRTNVSQTLLKERNVNRVTNVNVSINVGTRVPRSVRLVALPASIISIVPAYRTYRYFVVDERVCIVDPATYEIVDVITVSDRTAAGGSDRVVGGGSRLVLTEEERQIILSEIDLRDGSTLGLGAVTEGAEVPRSVELRTFPQTILQKVPKVKDHKFFTAENRVAIVDPQGTRVQLVLGDQRR